MIRARQVLHLALAGLLGGGYLALGHYVSVADRPGVLAVIVGLLPLAGLAFVSAWFSRARALALGAWMAAVLVIALNIHFLRDHAAWLYFLQHAGAMGVLALTFGATLRAGHGDALCSRIAGIIHEQALSAAYLHYTWKVTLAWTLFFVASAVLSVGLFFWGQVEIWSVFANLLTPVLIGLMFVAEYLVRLRVLPEYSNVSIAAIIRAYRSSAHRQPKD